MSVGKGRRPGKRVRNVPVVRRVKNGTGTWRTPRKTMQITRALRFMDLRPTSAATISSLLMMFLLLFFMFAASITLTSCFENTSHIYKGFNNIEH